MNYTIMQLNYIYVYNLLKNKDRFNIEVEDINKIDCDKILQHILKEQSIFCSKNESGYLYNSEIEKAINKSEIEILNENSQCNAEKLMKLKNIKNTVNSLNFSDINFICSIEPYLDKIYEINCWISEIEAEREVIKKKQAGKGKRKTFFL